METKKLVGAAGAVGLLVGAVAAGAWGLDAGEDKGAEALATAVADYDAEVLAKDALTLKVDALEAEALAEAETEEPAEEEADELKTARDALAEANAKLELHAEAIDQDVLETGALALVSEELEDEDFREDLAERLGVEDVDDIVSVRFLDNDDREVDVELEDEGVEGTVSGELKVKYRAEGPDSDRHTTVFDASFELEEGEVDDYSLSE